MRESVGKNLSGLRMALRLSSQWEDRAWCFFRWTEKTGRGTASTRQTSWTALVYGNGRYVAVGENGAIISSIDGITWLQAPRQTTSGLNHVTHKRNFGFLAIGDDGVVLDSEDGLNWQSLETKTSASLRGVAVDGNTAVICGERGTLLFLTHWPGSSPEVQPLNSNTSEDLESVVHAQVSGQLISPSPPTFGFLVLGANGELTHVTHNSRLGTLVYPSADNLPSLSRASRFRAITGARFLSHLSWTNALNQELSSLLAINDEGCVLTAPNSAGPWLMRRMIPPRKLTAATFASTHERFYVVGGDATIFQSDSLAEGRLQNVSARGSIGTGENVLIAGFRIHGPNRKEILVRGLGPALTDFGVSSPIGKPLLSLFDSAGRAISSNSGWADTPNIGFLGAATERAGAHPLAANSSNAAILNELHPGIHTASVAAADGNAGIGLIEIYDADGTDDPSRITNLSIRGRVGTGDEVLIAGFVVAPSAPRRMLIRAIGPTLASFGVSAPVQDPVLTLIHQDGRPAGIRDNTKFPADTPAELRDAEFAVGAFPLSESGRDVSFIVTLPPGRYTAIVRDASDTAGIALVEIYELSDR